MTTGPDADIEALRRLIVDAVGGRRSPAERASYAQAVAAHCMARHRERDLFGAAAAGAFEAQPLPSLAEHEARFPEERAAFALVVDFASLLSALSGDDDAGAVAVACEHAPFHARLSRSRAIELEQALLRRAGDVAVVRARNNTSAGALAQQAHHDVVAVLVGARDIEPARAHALLVHGLVAGGGRRGWPAAHHAQESAPFVQAAHTLRHAEGDVAALLLAVVDDTKRSIEERAAAWYALVLATGAGLGADAIARGLRVHALELELEQGAGAGDGDGDADGIARHCARILAQQHPALVIVDLQERGLLPCEPVPLPPVHEHLPQLAARTCIRDVERLLREPDADLARARLAAQLAGPLVERTPAALLPRLLPLLRAAALHPDRALAAAAFSSLLTALRACAGRTLDGAVADALLALLAPLASVGTHALQNLAPAIAQVGGMRERVVAALVDIVRTPTTSAGVCLDVCMALSNVVSPYPAAAADALVERILAGGAESERRDLAVALLERAPARMALVYTAQPALLPLVEEMHAYHMEERGFLMGLHAYPPRCDGLARALGADAVAAGIVDDARDLGRRLACAVAAPAAAKQSQSPSSSAALLSALRVLAARADQHEALVERRQREVFVCATVAVECYIAITRAMGAPPDVFAALESALDDVTLPPAAHIALLGEVLGRGSETDAMLVRLMRALVVEFTGKLTAPSAPAALLQSALQSLAHAGWRSRKRDVLEPLLTAWPALLSRTDVSAHARATSLFALAQAPVIDWHRPYVDEARALLRKVADGGDDALAKALGG